MNFRLYIVLFAVLLGCFAACARKEKAVVDLRTDEKVIEVKQDEVRLDDVDLNNDVTGQQSTQAAPLKMSDRSEVTVMYDGYGNKLEKRYFKGHPRLNSVLIRTGVNGQREILVYGQNGEKKPIDGEIANRLMNAPADEIANAAKLYENRSVFKGRTMITQNQQTKPQTPVYTSVPQQVQTVPQPETTVQEPVQETPKTADSNENSPTKPQKGQVKDGEPENDEKN